MTGEDDVPTLLRVERRPHAQAHLVGLPAKQLGVDRPHEGAHAIRTSGRGAGRQPFEVPVRTRDVAVRAGCDVDNDVSALRHEYGSLLANGKEQTDGLIVTRRRVQNEATTFSIRPSLFLSNVTAVQLRARDRPNGGSLTNSCNGGLGGAGASSIMMEVEAVPVQIVDRELPQPPWLLLQGFNNVCT